MSLLRNPPHTVTVQQYERVPGRYGDAWEPAGDPVEHPCSVQPLSSEEAQRLGVQVSTTMRILCKSWPFGTHSMITYNGHEWEQVAEARHYRMSSRTAHDDVVIRKVGADG